MSAKTEKRTAKPKKEKATINAAETATETAPPSTGDSEGKDELQTVKDELGKEKERFLRLFAEFENYKKRTGRERVELFKTAGRDVMTSLLPVMDDFDRAVKEIGKLEDNSIYEGILLVRDKFAKTLTGNGLSVCEVQKGDPFDADLHEAVTQAPAPSKDLKGKIIEVVEKGYKLGDTILRFPKVIIGN